MKWDGRDPLTEWPEVDWAEFVDGSFQPIWTERPRVSAELLAVNVVTQSDGFRAERRIRTVPLMDRRDLLIGRGFSVSRHDYTERGVRANALLMLVRQLPGASAWIEADIQRAVERLNYIDDAVILLRRYIRSLSGGSLSDKQRMRKRMRAALGELP